MAGSFSGTVCAREACARASRASPRAYQAWQRPRCRAAVRRPARPAPRESRRMRGAAKAGPCCGGAGRRRLLRRHLRCACARSDLTEKERTRVSTRRNTWRQRSSDGVILTRCTVRQTNRRRVRHTSRVRKHQQETAWNRETWCAAHSERCLREHVLRAQAHQQQSAALDALLQKLATWSGWTGATCDYMHANEHGAGRRDRKCLASDVRRRSPHASRAVPDSDVPIRSGEA